MTRLYWLWRFIYHFSMLIGRKDPWRDPAMDAERGVRVYCGPSYSAQIARALATFDATSRGLGSRWVRMEVKR